MLKLNFLFFFSGFTCGFATSVFLAILVTDWERIKRFWKRR